VSDEPRQPRIAFLVACHNDGETLGETIESLRTERDSELVVVDDGSTDPATLALLAALEEKRAVKVLHQANAGPSAAWTTGLGATSARYVMPFSSDDVLIPGAADLLANALDADDDASFAWGDIETFELANAYRPSVPLLCPWLVTFANCMPAYSLFRRTALASVGGWQVIKASEDWDLWMRFAASDHRGVYVDQPIYRYRRTSDSRFRRRGSHYEPFYAELAQRNRDLFAARSANRRASAAPIALKLTVPVANCLPLVPRLRKMQLCEALTLLCWSGGVRRTTRIVAQGVLFRLRILRRRAA
jgi:glycosyltransferase involved in cell wall biosynthesis